MTDVSKPDVNPDTLGAEGTVAPPEARGTLAPPIGEDEGKLKAVTEMEGPVPFTTLVTIENPTDKALRFKYENQPWIIPANSQGVMPYYCAVIWFGDPRAKDHPTDRRLRKRTDELDRVSAKWGIYASGNWHLIPQVIIKDAAGNELIFPALDPYGEKAHPGSDEYRQHEAQQRLLMQQAQEMREELAKTQAELERYRQAERAQKEAVRPGVTPDMPDLEIHAPDDETSGEAIDGDDLAPAPDDLDDILGDGGLDDDLPDSNEETPSTKDLPPELRPIGISGEEQPIHRREGDVDPDSGEIVGNNNPEQPVQRDPAIQHERPVIDSLADEDNDQ